MSFAAVCRSPCCGRQSLLYVAHGDDCLMPICSPHSPLLKRGWFIRELSTFIFIFFLLSLSLSLSLSRSFFPFSHPFIIFVLLIISSPIKPVSNEASFYFLPSPSLLLSSGCILLKKLYTINVYCTSIIRTQKSVLRAQLLHMLHPLVTATTEKNEGAPTL